MTRFLFVLFLLLPLTSQAAEKKILMLGNSYTAGTVRYIKTAFKQAAPEYSITSVTPGGKDLRYHLTSDASLGKIKSEKWDLLIIQGQSLEAAASAKHTENFQKMATGLAALAKEQGIPRVMVFQTWGRRDGHKGLKNVYPDFETMSKKVTQQYEIAAKNNGMEIAPVGAAFAVIHKDHNELFRGLYRNDGSHPSPQAGYLAACVFYGAITGKSPETIVWQDKLDEKTAGILKQAAAKALEK
jgi:hypothetical protein